MICEECIDQKNNFSEIESALYRSAEELGWSTKSFFKCKIGCCRNHKDNLDQAYEDLGLIPKEKK